MIIYILSIGYLLLIIIMIVKFFQIASDLAEVKSTIQKRDSKPDKKTPVVISDNFDHEFLSVVISGNKDKARDMLFDKISKSKEFSNILTGENDTFYNNDVDSLNITYKKYMDLVDLAFIDYDKVRGFKVKN